MLVDQTPDALDEAMRALDTGIGPFQRLLRRRGEHHEQAHGVGTEAIDHRLRVHAVVLGLGHLLGATDFHRQTIGLQYGLDGAALVVGLDVHVQRVEPVAAALGVDAVVGVRDHHALGQQLLERLVAVDQAEVTHQLVEEARVEQVQDGVLDATDVVIDRQPVVGALVQHGIGVVRTAEARVVPGGLHEGVEGIGLALPAIAQVTEGRHLLDRRATGGVEFDFQRQSDRQFVVGQRDGFTVRAILDRDRRAPVTLTGDAPVAQTEVGLDLTTALLDQARGDGIEGALEVEAIEVTGVDQHAVLGEGSFADVGRIAVGIGDHGFDRQVVLGGEFVVTLVVGRHGHHGTGAVFHQYEVGDEDRHFTAGQRVDGLEAGIHAAFFHGRHVGFAGAATRALGVELGKLRIVLRRGLGQRVSGGDADVGHTHQGVRTGGEDGQGFLHLAGLGIEAEAQLDTARLADPVALHGLDLLRPLDLVEVGQQLFGIIGDAQEPLRDFLALDQRAGTPATAVDDLLIGEHGLVRRVPVDDGTLLVDDTLLDQLGEEPLLPAIVFQVAGGEFTAPVVGEAQRLELIAHVGDVLVGPLARRDVVLHRGVFRRQAEGVPAHRLHDVLALHALEARDHVTDGVVAHVTHVQLAAGVGEHRQAVELLAVGIFHRLETLIFLPVLLGSLFDLIGSVLLRSIL